LYIANASDDFENASFMKNVCKNLNDPISEFVEIWCLKIVAIPHRISNSYAAIAYK
jgi:hypothetical protein